MDGIEKEPEPEQEKDQEQEPKVKPGGDAATAAKEEDEPAPVTDGQEAAVEDLDLCFAVDCTGSMASDIA